MCAGTVVSEAVLREAKAVKQYEDVPLLPEY